MENNYARAERIGREIFKRNIIDRVRRLLFTTNPSCPYDGFLTGFTDLTGVLEIKNRDIPDDAYFDRWLLEEKKAVPLIAAAITSGYNMALYIVITQHYIRIWDLLTIDLNYETGYFTHSTATNYKKGSEEKSVAYLKEKDLLCKILRKDIPS